MASKFPYKPTPDEQRALQDFIYLFARLYPCGDCAAHFKLVLDQNPPDVSGREGVTQWACKVHNVVNKRLGKPIFDCSTIGDMWKCGCADEDGEAAAGPAASAAASGSSNSTAPTPT
ncbi:ERV/ALR sulfhydryl oxidase domain-containing protein [Entophlyctis helioformis]|nr:ERV/ALR sulfhydryl oxidase domain-containing protein [Entophlyctis helioformis]